MATWADVLNSQQPAWDAEPTAPGSNPLDDGVLMTSGMKHANKCRQCSKTVDVGVPGWFNKDGEPGRKVTCQECHQKKVDAQPPGATTGDATNGLLDKTIKKKQRKLVPKFTPELLLDKDRGITSVFKNFPRIKFKGKGHETSDLRKLISKYAEWAQILVPNMEFTDFIEKLEKNSGNGRVRAKLEMIRNVQQGFCMLDDIEDYELADKGDNLAGDSWEHGLANDDDHLSDWDDGPAVTPMQLTAEQRARIERNKQLAVERAAARNNTAGTSASASGPGAPQFVQVTDESDIWEEIDGVGGETFDGFGAFDEEAEAEAGFDAFDEEAEADMFDIPSRSDLQHESVPVPPAEVAREARAYDESQMNSLVENDVEMDSQEGLVANAVSASAEEDPLGAHLDEAIAQAMASQQARAEAQAAAEALEAGIDDDEEF